MVCLSFFFFLEDGEIKSFCLIMLCYGYFGLFGIVDSVFILYCIVIIIVFDR